MREEKMQMETSLRGRLTLVLWAAAAALFLLGPGSGTAISAASATPAPLAPASSFTPSTTVTRLRCEYAVNPLGIDAARPRLSWALESSRRGTRQTAYRILVASRKSILQADRGDLWDSGRVTSSQSVHVPYAGNSLASRTRCYWKVRVWDQAGARSEWSSPAWWETGLLHPSDWQARWIGAPYHTELEGGGPAPYFRKAFALAGDIRWARAYVCGLGYFELRLNGRKVGEDVLVPSHTDYTRRPQLKNKSYPYEDNGAQRVLYLTYDVTEDLKRGENVVGAILGSGYFHNRRDIEGDHDYGSPRLLCQMEITLVDGSHHVIATGPDWRVSRGPIAREDVYEGEIYDATWERPGWDQPGYDDTQVFRGAAWQAPRLALSPTGQLRAQMAPTDRVVETLKPARITPVGPGSGSYLVDFGQNFAGWARLRVQGPAGHRVTLSFGEELNGRTLDRTYDQTNVYVLRGEGREEYEPRFTWYGFRHVLVQGWPGALTAADIDGRVVHTAVEPTGEFECPSDRFNQIDRAFAWTQKSNMHGGVCSDCPHAERLPYTGDGQAASEAAIHHFDMAAFYTKWLNDMQDAQNPRDGYVPHTAPFQGAGGGAGWGSAYAIIPWRCYEYYGDTQILREHYAGMKKWVGYLATWARDGIVRKQRPGEWVNLGDWCVPGTPPPAELVDTYFYAQCALNVARAARVLGRDRDALQYEALYRSISAAFHRAFYDAGAGHYGPNGATALALSIGVSPPALRPAVVQALVDMIHGSHQDHLDTGIFATPCLFDVLCQEGHADLAYAMMNQTTAPSYGWCLDQGATTIWEQWSGKGSHNHPMFAGGVVWLYRHLAGVQADPSRPGYEHVIIRPQPVAGIAHASYYTSTLRGRVGAAWENQSGAFRLRASVPPNSTATVWLPAPADADIREGALPARQAEGVNWLRREGDREVWAVASGEYDFSVRAP
jgi:alpha-L-rhamnosidase